MLIIACKNMYVNQFKINFKYKIKGSADKWEDGVRGAKTKCKELISHFINWRAEKNYLKWMD